MIRLEKSPIPAWLKENQEALTANFVAAPANAKPAPWRAAAVVDALRAECMGKCMYCEGRIDDVSYSAVEHIRPKGVFPELVLDWDNLGLVCPRCNTNKRDYWTLNAELQLLDPYVDDVDVHLQFYGGLVTAELGSQRGANTVRKFKFNTRSELVMAKILAIEGVHARIERWHTETEPELKELFADDLREAIAPRHEFSATLKAYAASKGFSP
ncbi:HNH endonuclease [Microbacterium sp. NPDC078428]|uniref:HNH endonuclease n=1 Tax=Microbacterium sp. NPDC078428 TaxID=3364190 RepID=UPI0037CB241A